MRIAAVTGCEHKRVTVMPMDQTLGVDCLDCLEALAWCWMDKHVPERLWNRACENDSNAIRCAQDREDVCALCEETIR